MRNGGVSVSESTENTMRKKERYQQKRRFLIQVVSESRIVTEIIAVTEKIAVTELQRWREREERMSGFNVRGLVLYSDGIDAKIRRWVVYGPNLFVFSHAREIVWELESSLDTTHKFYCVRHAHYTINLPHYWL